MKKYAAWLEKQKQATSKEWMEAAKIWNDPKGPTKELIHKVLQLEAKLTQQGHFQQVGTDPYTDPVLKLFLEGYDKVYQHLFSSEEWKEIREALREMVIENSHMFWGGYAAKFSALKDSSKKISITPEMFDLLTKIKNEGVVKKAYIMKTPYASKTAKSLERHQLVARDSNFDFILSPRGQSLMQLDPRWSGTTEDHYHRAVQVWNVFDYGDHFANFSAAGEKKEFQTELAPTHNRPTVYAADENETKTPAPAIPEPAPEAPVAVPETLDGDDFEEGADAKLQVMVTSVTLQSRMDDLTAILRPFPYTVVLEEGGDAAHAGVDNMMLTIWPLKHLEARDSEVRSLEAEYQLPFEETRKLDEYGSLVMDGNSTDVAIVSGPTTSVLESVNSRMQALLGGR